MVQPKEPNTSDKQLIALGRVLQALREEENSDALIQTVIQYLDGEFDYSLIWVGLYDRLEHRLFGKGGISPGGDPSFLKQRFSLKPGDVLEQVVIQQRAMALPDLREEQRIGEWRKLAQKANIQGTVIFPIRYRDRCYGVILLGTPIWGASPPSEEKARLSMVLGEFATALFKIETEWQRQQTKHPGEPLLALLENLRSLTGLGPRLEAILEETQNFIQPTRTSVYWYERERRYFWRRMGNRHRNTVFGGTNQPASGITVQEVNGFYQALAANQLVSIGEAHSSLRGDITTRLMQQIRARSLLAAPILFQDELLGFLAVEGQEPRIWTDHEKQFLQGAAQLIALTAPLETMETTIEQIRRDQELTAEIGRSVYDEDDWKATLKQAADQICKRLKAERFLVLLYDKDQTSFETAYQTHPSNRRPLTVALPALPEAAHTLVQQSQTALGIESLDGDWSLAGWRDRLLELGVRSVLLCSTSMGHGLEGVILICHEVPRSWNRAERELVRIVSQQIGFMLHQWQLQRRIEQQEIINKAIQWGLRAMQQTHQPGQLERSLLQHLTDVLQVPLAALVTWLPGHPSGKILSSPPPNERFAVNGDMTVPVHTDPLIQAALAGEGPIQQTVEQVSSTTRQWLYGSGIGTLLLLALRTAPEHEPTGVLIVVDEGKRRWTEQHLRALDILGGQFAWTRRSLTLTSQLMAQHLELEQLNWYKHRRLEETYRTLGTGLQRLDDLGNPKEPLFVTRQQQTLHYLKDAIAPLAQSLNEEQWQIRTYPTTISLISFLKRSLERVDALFKQRQLWTQVHDETNLTLRGDILKLELILYELLRVTCQRSPVGGRIDLWCRQIDNRWFELSITDMGHVEPTLFKELESGRQDWLAASILDRPPGLHLLICKTLITQLGGQFSFYQLEDGRNIGRLVLPLAVNSIPKPESKGH